MAVVDNVSTADPAVFPVGGTQPPLYYAILASDGTTQDMTGATATFFMRQLLSRNPIITGSATPLVPIDANGNNVRYDWQTNDRAIEGEFMGWFGYTLPGSSLIETPEFRIVITDQGPGYGTETGVVVDGIAQWMPTTVNALRREPSFGDRMLQKHADAVKRTVMGVAVTPDDESAYDPLLVEYLSKATALRIITPARDYWARQYRQVLTQGPSESATYPDMLQNLDALERRLRHELAQDWRQLQYILPGLPQRRVEPAPMSSLGDPSTPGNGYVSADPQRTQPIRTGGPRWNIFPFV